MKYKKQVVIIFLITFLTVSFSFNFVKADTIDKPNERFFPVVVSPPVIWALGEIAVSLGVVAVGSSMLYDIGSRIKDDLGDKLLPYIVDGGIKLTAELLKSIASSCESLPNEEILDFTPIDLPTIKKDSFNYTHVLLPEEGDYKILRSYNIKGSEDWIKFNVYSGDVLLKTVQQIFRSDIRIGFGISRSGFSEPIRTECDIFIYRSDGSIAISSSQIIKDMYIGKNLRVELEFEHPLDRVTSYDYTHVKDNYSKDNYLTTSPSISDGTHTGVWELPSDSVIEGYQSGAIDFPITDSVGDKVTSLPLEDVIVDGTVDGTIDGTIGGITEGIGSITGLLQNILDFIKSIFIPTELEKIDFSPLYFSFSDKFPFCIPFDLIRMIKEFQSTEEKPIFHVDMSPFSSNKYSRGEVGFTIDLTKFDDLIKIVRTLTLISFIFTIAFKTRDIIKG